MKGMSSSTVAVIALAMLGVGSAEAAPTISTAAQFRVGRAFTCPIVNVGTRDVTVTIELVNGSGVVELFSSSPLEIPPGHMKAIGFTSTSGGSVLYCRFVVHQGSKTHLRGSSCVGDDAGACQASTDAR